MDLTEKVVWSETTGELDVLWPLARELCLPHLHLMILRWELLEEDVHVVIQCTRLYLLVMLGDATLLPWVHSGFLTSL